MSSLILSAPISAITGGNTADNELTLGKFGQKSKVLVTVTPESGPILFAMNESSDAGASVAAGSSLQFQMNDGDVLHFTQTAADDYFSVVVVDLDSNISLPASQGMGQSATYLVYTALLSQTGTSAPVPTILENTLGDIVWGYDVAGSYSFTLLGKLPANKTFVTTSNGWSGQWFFLSYPAVDGDSFYFEAVHPTTGENNWGNVYIEIRVYK